MLGKAREKGILDINLINIRDYTEDKHNRVDDTNRRRRGNGDAGAAHPVGLPGKSSAGTMLYVSLAAKC